MKTFTGWQWLLIDAANQFGHDKMVFEDRIEWAETNLRSLDDPRMIDMAEKKTRPLFIKAVMAIRKAQAGIATGHMVGVDACCSGIQIMSVLTGCVAGARATGLIDPHVRSDAYGAVTGEMNTILGGNFTVPREHAKKATMTSFYGSKEQPKDMFGEGTPELEAFYEAAQKVAPGAWELLQDLLASWQPYALSHNWKLPDGFDARVKVMTKFDLRIEVDELDHASFTYEFYENQGDRRGLSNAANVTHSMDGFVLREMHRRCNYDRKDIEAAACAIEIVMIQRKMGEARETNMDNVDDTIIYYKEQFERSSLPSAVILPYLAKLEGIKALSDEHIEHLAIIANGMLQYQPFPLVTVHDEFKAHANNIDAVRWQYKEILAEIADSNVIDDILSQIHGRPNHFNKLSFNLGDQIRGSNYGLC